MAMGARGLGWGVMLCCALALAGCTQQQMRTARDNTLGFFGIARKPAVASPAAAPAPSPAAAAVPAEPQEPVPAAAPRAPVETDGLAPPPSVRPRKNS